jgi:hypothetical protein
LGEIGVVDMRAHLNAAPAIIKRKKLSKGAGTMVVCGKLRMPTYDRNDGVFYVDMAVECDD